MRKNTHLTIVSLKDLLEEFYIYESSVVLGVSEDAISYVDSSRILCKNSPIDRCKLKTIKKDAEEKLKKFLDTFNCSRNLDVEDFLHDLSVDFQKKNKTRTYLIVDKSEIVAYFSLAIKPVFIDPKNISSKNRRLANSRKIIDTDLNVISTYLIGQIGRDDKYDSSQINLESILGYVFAQIDMVKSLIGGSNILIEVDNEKKLIDLYKKYGFQYLQTDTSNLSQLWFLSIDY